MVDGEPVQRVGAAGEVALSVVDVTVADDPHGEARRVVTDSTQTSFDITKPPLWTALLVRIGPDEHLFEVTMAHIIADGWSAGVLWSELTQLYEAHVAGSEAVLPELPMQYPDYARWQHDSYRGDVADGMLGYWREQLAALPTLDLPSDRPRPAVQTFAGGRWTFTVGPEVLTPFKTMASREGCTLFMATLAVFNVLLARYAGQEDVAVGTPVANRTRAELEPLIGLFVNTVVLRTDLSGDPSVRECLRRARDVAIGAMTHGETPFEQLVVELRPDRDLSRNPLFQVMFNFLGSPAVWRPLGEAGAEELELDYATSKFDLTLALQEAPEGLRAIFEYNVDLFDERTIQRMEQHFRMLLAGAAARPDASVWELPMLTDVERDIALATPKRTAYPDRCLHTLVEEQVERSPDAIAVLAGDRSLTYRELNTRANQLAHHLRALGARPESLIGLSVERSIWMPIGMLGILKSGAAYVPMDPHYPPDRLAFMLEDAGASLLVTQAGVAAALPGPVSTPVVLDGEDDPLAEQPTDNPECVTHARSLAHVIYSSGSTGRPKGALIEHKSLVNVFTAFADRPGLTADDVLIAVTNISFDLAGLDMFLPLLVGARMVIATRDVVADGRRLAELIAECGGTFLDATPSTWRLLAESGWQGEKKLLCVTGGEMMPRDLAEHIAATCRGLWDCYAPCESTIYSTRYEFVPGGPLSVGVPLSNTRFHLLDRHGQPTPIGVPGDIHIGGDGLARGYHARPGLTAERFVADPFAKKKGERLYRTGDLARWSPDGNLELLGRLDHQIKLRGFRIELGEIEHALRQHPAVREGAVVARIRQEGAQQLVGYVVFEPDASATVSELRSALREVLPEFMLPSGFVTLDALPLTPNGKVDRKLLSRGDEVLAVGAESYVAPRTPMEKAVAAIWQRVLGVDRVGVHDNFFELGGHSLLAMKVVYEMEQEVGQEFLAMDLLVETLEQFARTAEQRGAGVVAAAEPGDRLQAAPRAEMNPLFFGASAEQLYGVHHPPQAPAVPGGAVLLCTGLGHEAMAAHSSLQQLARRLSAAGLHVLRFDYAGCGDSAGDLEAASVERWVRDVRAAARELGEMADAGRVSVVGLRLGASLAARAAGEAAFASCVLWEPVVCGRDYLDELAEEQRHWLRATFVRRRPAIHEWGGPQVLGFSMPDALRRDLAALDLERLSALPGERVLIVQNIEGRHLEGLRQHLLRLGDGVTHETIHADRPWMGESGAAIAVAPVGVLRRIAEWITAGYGVVSR